MDFVKLSVAVSIFSVVGILRYLGYDYSGRQRKTAVSSILSDNQGPTAVISNLSDSPRNAAVTSNHSDSQGHTAVTSSHSDGQRNAAVTSVERDQLRTIPRQGHTAFYIEVEAVNDTGMNAIDTRNPLVISGQRLDI